MEEKFTGEVKKEVHNPFKLALYYFTIGLGKGIWWLLINIYSFAVDSYKKYYPIAKEYVIIYIKWLSSIVKDNIRGGARLIGALLTLLPISIILWFLVFAPTISPFVMSEKADIYNIKEYEGKGISTIHSIMDPLKTISKTVLMTNFLGVRFWDDNRYEQQTGQFVMDRQKLFALRDYLGRNRSSNGQNKFLVSAHNEISVDSGSVFPVNFDRQLSKTIKWLEKYKLDLEDDRDKNAKDKTAVFIVNSDNLAKTVRLLREQLMSESDPNKGVSFMNADKDYYILRGNLISLYQYFKGIEPDFKNKMKEKTAYNDSYIPLVEMMKDTIEKKPFFVMEWIKHDVSALRGKAQTIATKMNEFANKLADG